MRTSNPTYERRILRVLSHIHDNLDGDLSLEALASVACMSPFHWHRIFYGITGETLANCIRRVRLDRASYLLLQSDQNVAEIARQCGYGNVQSFARSFKHDYGLTPSKFRKSDIAYRASETPTQSKVPPAFEIEIKALPKLRLVSQPHYGAYQLLGRTASHLHARLAVRDENFLPEGASSVAILHDDPFLVPEDELRSDIGFVIPDSAALPSEFSEVTISPSRSAVLHYTGPYVGLFEAYRYLYGHWVPNNGVELSDDPIYAIILEDPRGISPNDLRTDICLPLAD